jgi:hypothetical protein
MCSDKQHYFDQIPLYINGLLSLDEKSEFEEMTKAHPDLEKELSLFQDMESSFNADENIEDEHFDTLFSKIEQNISALDSHSIKIPVENSESLISKLAGLFAIPQLAWGVAAMQMVILLSVVNFNTGEEQTYATLSGSTDTSVTQQQKINVVFDDTASNRQIRELLLSANAQITDGPSKIGSFIISTNKENAQATLTKLQNTSWVSFAEPRY